MCEDGEWINDFWFASRRESPDAARPYRNLAATRGSPSLSLEHMTTNTTEVERRLWAAADNLRANSKLRSHEYSTPVLGLIFLAYADHRFEQAQATLGADAEPMDFQAEGVMYLPEQARYRRLLALPDSANLGQAINDAMKAVETENEDLKDVLPKIYNRLDNSVLAPLLEGVQLQRDRRWPRRRRLRQGLRVLPGRVRQARGSTGRRVLHAHQPRQADGGDHGAVPRTHL